MRELELQKSQYQQQQKQKLNKILLRKQSVFRERILTSWNLNQLFLCCKKSKTVASSEGNTSSGGEPAPLLSKLGGAIFGQQNSPQKVVSNIRGYLSNRLSGAIPDTGKVSLSYRCALVCISM